MSASSKKKLRKEQKAAALTERQKRERKEAKQTKIMTISFVLAIVLILAGVVGIFAGKYVPGIIDRNTTAITVGDHEITTTELSYFYIDAINEHQETVYNQYYNSFGNYWTIMLGFDPTKALDAQKYEADDVTVEKTWAQHFIDTAIDNARDVYALYDDAKANGYTLPEDDQDSLDTYFENLETYATYYGYSNVNAWLRNSYGEGANEKTYKSYYEACTYASAYLNKYSDELKYDQEDYRAYEKDKFDDYSVVSYVYYSMSYNSYLGEGTKGEDGKTTWTDAQKEAAREALKKDMETIIGTEIKDKADFDKAIQALEVNKPDKDDKNAKLPTSTEVKNTFFDDIVLHAAAADWLQEKDRKAGDFKAFEVYTYADHDDPEHEHDDDCGCSRTVDGYTIVLFTNRIDHTAKMVNVRHILVKFNGGATANNETTYTDEEKAEAKAEAERLLKVWEDGKKNEESFGELANKESDDQNGKVTNGGLYEDIYQGQMVQAFEDWCFDANRKPGDTGIVETKYGYHVMYFSSVDEMSYRDVMIENDLREEDTNKWKDALADKATYVEGNLKGMKYDFILQEQ